MPSINYRISLDGSQEVNKELLSIEQAIKRLQKAAKDSTGAASFASTTASISKLGSTAEEAFVSAGVAANKFGVSIAELRAVDSIIAELRGKSRETGVAFATLARNYDIARAAALQTGAGLRQSGAAAGAAAGATKELNTALGVTRGQLSAFSKVANVVGLGALAQLASVMRSSSVNLGAVAAGAAGLAVVGAALTKFALDAVKASEGVAKLSDVSGVSFSELSKLQGAFQLGGVSAEEFSQEFTKLVADYGSGSKELEKANLAVRESHLALAQAQQQGLQIAQQFAELQLQAAQRAQQAEQAGVQAQQYQVQEQSLRRQLSLLPQVNALESDRAALAVRDVQGQLQLLDLEDDLAERRITSLQFERQKKQLTADERKRRREALELQKREAEQRQQALQDEQKQKKQQLEMQLKQLEMQKQSLELQEQQRQQQEKNAEVQQKSLQLQQQAQEIAVKRAEIETKAAEKAAKLATVQDEAAKAVLRGADGMGDLADAVQRMSASEQIDFQKKTGFTDKTMALLRKGREGVEENQRAVEKLGLSLDETDRTNLKAFGESWDKVTGIAIAGSQKLGAGFVRAMHDMTTLPVTETLRRSLVGIGRVLKEVFIDSWAGIGAGMGTAAKTAFDFVASLASSAARGVVGAWNTVVQFFGSIGQSIGSAFGAAWQIISSLAGQAAQMVINVWNSVVQFFAGIGEIIGNAFGAAWQKIVDGASTAYQSIINFVTTPVGNAWQWIVDTWNAMLGKLGLGGGGGGAAPATAGGTGFARGGLLGGRGSGTSDSNLAWLSRGEYVTPARAVAQPGVLAFLEALRQSGGNLRNVLDGMGRFALGGMVRGPIGMPAFAGGGMNNVTIQFPGLPEISGLRASSGVVDELRKAAALAQVRSGGRKPSRYS